MPEIKLSADELSLMSMLARTTGATAKDCVIDDKMNRIIFVVPKGQMGLAIGKEGGSVKKMERVVRRPVEVVEEADDVEGLVRNTLGKHVLDVKVAERLDGTSQVVVTVDPRKKGAVVGMGGRHAEKLRLLMRRYFGITSVQITSDL